jgi:hypothetical protein
MAAYTKGYALEFSEGFLGSGSTFWPGLVAADIFVSKFDSSLETLEFSTYLGGGGHDVGPQIALDNSGTIHVAGTTMGFPIGLTNDGLSFQNSGVADDFPTLHAAQAQFGGGFFLVPNDPAVRTLADGTVLLGSRDFFSSHTNDLPADGFVLAIDQLGALKGTLTDLNGDPVSALAPGQQFSGVVATFTDPRIDADPGEFTGIILWGDGTVSTGSADGVSVVRDLHTAGVFDVIGTHTFTNPGAYPIQTLVDDQRTPHSVKPGSNDESGALTPEPNLDLAPRIFNQGETSIAVDPTNPNRLFAVATDTASDLTAAISSDGGATWSTEIIATGGSDGLLPALSDERAVFDQFGNLFLTYIDSTGNNIVLASSRDGGKTFKLVGNFTDPGGADVDQPAIATGPDVGGGSGGTLWLSFHNGSDGSLQVVGMAVSGALDAQNSQLGPTSNFSVPPDPNEDSTQDFMGLAVGAGGQVMITFRQAAFTTGASIYASINPQGLDGSFGAAVKVTDTNVGGGKGSGIIPAAPRGPPLQPRICRRHDRSCPPSAPVRAWPCSSGFPAIPRPMLRSSRRRTTRACWPESSSG